MLLKDIQTINKQFSNGCFANKSNLESALDMHPRDYAGQLASIIRALLAGHCFTDGNKRTCTVLILKWGELFGVKIKPEKIFKTIQRLKNETGIAKIRAELKRTLR